MDHPGNSEGKESACNVGDMCSVSRSGRSPGEGNGYPLQHSCLENSMDGGARVFPQSLYKKNYHKEVSILICICVLLLFS